MGVTEYPCPKCGQAQRVRAPNGTEVNPRLCAACQEQEAKDKHPRESQGSGNAQEEKHEEEGGKKARAR